MSANKILILGAGYTGKTLAQLARSNEFSVAATTRNQNTVDFLEQQLEADVAIWSTDEDPGEWISHLGPRTAVVYSIPTLFRSYESGGNEFPRHLAPVAEVMELCRSHGSHRFVYLSSSSVYGDQQGEWVDESTSCRPNSALGKMRHDIENYLLEVDAEFPVNIARIVGIYGPGRTLVDYIKSGRYTLVDGGKGVTNRIHVYDIARAILAIITRGPDENRIYNITDGHPQPARDLIEFICTKTGLEPPREETFEEYAKRKEDSNLVARKKNSLRVLNDRIRRELEFQLDYPDVFSGYQAILDSPDYS